MIICVLFYLITHILSLHDGIIIRSMLTFFLYFLKLSAGKGFKRIRLALTFLKKGLRRSCVGIFLAVKYPIILLQSYFKSES